MGLNSERLRFTTNKHPPAFGVTHKTITQCSPGAFERPNPGFGLRGDALTGAQCGHDFTVTVGKANAGQGEVLALAGQRIRPTSGSGPNCHHPPLRPDSLGTRLIRPCCPRRRTGWNAHLANPVSTPGVTRSHWPRAHTGREIAF